MLLPAALSLPLGQNFPRAQLTSSRRGGHLKEARGACRERGEEAGKGVRKGTPSTLPQQHPRRAAAPGAQSEELGRRARRGTKVAAALPGEGAGGSGRGNEAPDPQDGARSAPPASRADPRVRGYYPEVQKAGVGQRPVLLLRPCGAGAAILRGPESKRARGGRTRRSPAGRLQALNELLDLPDLHVPIGSTGVVRHLLASSSLERPGGARRHQDHRVSAAAGAERPPSSPPPPPRGPPLHAPSGPSRGSRASPPPAVPRGPVLGGSGCSSPAAAPRRRRL